MNDSYTVESGIPLPKPRRGSGHAGPPMRYPWLEMQPGDSFFVALDGRSADSLSSMLCTIGRRQFRVATRVVVEDGSRGIRVWRVE